MNRSTSRILFLLAILSLIPGPTARTADGEVTSSEDTHSWEALVHFRLPDGSQETVRLDDFCFVYYDRYFKKTASKVGGPMTLKVRDVPREVMSIQNENQVRLRFWAITRIRFEYRKDGSGRRLYLVATPSSPRKHAIVWPVDTLRNTAISHPPHFQGRRDGELVEVLLPPYTEEPRFEGKVLTGIDLQFVGQKKHRSWM